MGVEKIDRSDSNVCSSAKKLACKKLCQVRWWARKRSLVSYMDSSSTGNVLFFFAWAGTASTTTHGVQYCR